jgi:hypothetical protein
MVAHTGFVITCRRLAAAPRPQATADADGADGDVEPGDARVDE